MYAPDPIREWAQTFNGGSEETQLDNEGSGKKEVLKWLDAGVIYPISDNLWVSQVQVVPKNGGTTVIRTENNALLPS